MAKIINLRENKEFEVKGGRKIREALEELGINPTLYVIVKNGEIVTEEDYLEENDKVELIPVISGG